MKTTLLLFALVLTDLITNAQNENKSITSICDSTQQTEKILAKQIVQLKTSPQNELMPVYFNFRKRLLTDHHKNRIQPFEFLDLCRSIKDSAVQQQVARYDSYTKEKANLGLIALGNGTASFVLLGSALVSSGQNNTNLTAAYGFFGVAALVSIPVIAIYSSVPHQKRKAVLFRDLPIAYNQYVESLNNY